MKSQNKTVGYQFSSNVFCFQSFLSAEEISQKEAEEEGEEPNDAIIRVARDWDVWIDRERKLVIVDATICLREGALEMFACTPGTKEHESILVVDSMAILLHAALLAVGAEPGQPVQYVPEYMAATGTEIEIILLWTDEDGNRHQDRAQDWIRDTRTEKAMEYPFVFAGSGFWVDETTGERSYHAEGGEVICVSNFSTAMLDVPVASSADNAGLLFECFTEAIPPVDTPVRVVLRPKQDEEESPEE